MTADDKTVPVYLTKKHWRLVHEAAEYQTFTGTSEERIKLFNEIM